MSTLKSLGYATVELLLTPLQFGIPNSRLRYYLLAKMEPLSFRCPQSPGDDSIWRQIPGHGSGLVDSKSFDDHEISSVNTLSGYLDTDARLGQPHPRVVPDRVLIKWGRLFDIVLPSSRRSCCFTRGSAFIKSRCKLY